MGGSIYSVERYTMSCNGSPRRDFFSPQFTANKLKSADPSTPSAVLPRLNSVMWQEAEAICLLGNLAIARLFDYYKKPSNIENWYTRICADV